MQLDFLTPRVERLSAAGAWTTLHPGGAIGRLRTPVVLLARELTVFSRFETAALPRNRRRQAARLHARTGAPYLNAASLVVKSGADFGLWWWDVDRVDAMVRQRWGGQIPALRPETLAQPAGKGWRVVRLAEGHEAQYWRDGQVQASAWRRDRFDAGAWAAFTRVQRGAEDAPETPPAPQALPIDYDGPAFALATAEITREQMIGAAGGALATAALCAALLLAGQASDNERSRLLDDGAAALRAISLWLTPDGLWRDKRLRPHEFIDEAASASSLYHLMRGFTQLNATEGIRAISLA